MSKTWNFKKELCGCFGKPIAENPTQHMIEAAFRHHGLDWRYIQFEVGPDDLGDAIKGFRSMGFVGGNCTIPHKVAVIEHLDRLGTSAELMGAVNCIVRDGDALVGENTDGVGFVSSVQELRDPAGQHAVIIGAGGAARAIAVELALAGTTRITIVNRTPERGQALVDLLNDKKLTRAEFVAWSGDYQIPAGANIVVNATSIGLFPDLDARIALDIETLQPEMLVADVIPNPPNTRFVQDARARGCTVIDGLAMLVAQGVVGFKYWTNVDADPAVMRRALEEVFGESDA
ncbi:MAG: shikimate dehydrogenase [Planctomycetota bacterium]|jgi:shikimate dehydrogenase|nr:shikimate dehydrogenase [Planctomycetota bacterium]